MSILREIAEAIIGGDYVRLPQLCEKALAEGKNAGEIINNALISGMNEVGIKFKNNEFFVPEVLLAARAMQAGLAILKPLLVEGEFKHIGKIVLGTVKGDLHDIGKNLVGMMLTGGGFEVVDIGHDVSPDKFVAAIKEHNPTHVGMSALLTTTMPYMRETIKAIQQAGLRDKVKIMIGGAPVTQDYCDEIGADGYAPDASSAVELAKKLLG